MKTETDTISGTTQNFAYQYDAAGQLLSVNGETASYDANGNRSEGGNVPGPANRQQSDGTWNYTYDPNGNMATRTTIATGETWTYSYDNANHLTQAVDKDSAGNLLQTVTLKYDAFGQLVEQDVAVPGQATQTTTYERDVDGNIVAEYTNGVVSVQRRLYANINGQMQALAQIDGSGTGSWDLTDHLGSVRLVVDASGSVLGQPAYDVWGNTTLTVAGWDVGYAQGFYSSALTMNQFGERWLFNTRWISPDPMGLLAGPNPYQYSNNAPTNECNCLAPYQ